MWKVIVGILILALLVVTNPGKEAHWTECEAFFEAQAAKESRNASWLDKFGFWLLKDSIQSALYINNYGVCSVGRIEGRVVTFGICGAVIFVGKD